MNDKWEGEEEGGGCTATCIRKQAPPISNSEFSDCITGSLLFSDKVPPCSLAGLLLPMEPRLASDLQEGFRLCLSDYRCVLQRSGEKLTDTKSKFLEPRQQQLNPKHITKPWPQLQHGGGAGEK